MVTVSDFNRGIAGGNTGARKSNSSNNDPSGGRRQAYEDMASVGIQGVSGRTTDDDKGKRAREIQRDSGFQTTTQDSDRDREEQLYNFINEASKKEEKKEEKTDLQKFYDFAFGTEGDTSVKKSGFEQSGKHPLRAQLDYLIGKYGDSVLDTEQGKVLMGYLSGVPVERGGGLGARDDTYGGGDFTLDPESKEFQEAESYRKQLIDQITSNSIFAKDMMTFDNKDYDNLGIGFLRSDAFDADLARKGLSPEQYFNFRQQLMASDPTAENQGYKDAFPFSSGAGLGAILEKVMPGSTAISAITGSILPERNMAGYQGTNDPFAATFRALPESQDRASGIMRASSAPPVPPPVVPPVVPPEEDEVPENPILNPTMSQRDPFDLAKFYASLPQYTQQGVMSPSLMQYYRNLGLFPRA